MVIFDLDMTLVDTSIAEAYRNKRQWDKVYSLIPAMRVYPQIKSLVDHFHANRIKIAVVTNSPSQYASRVLKHFSLHYDALVAFHDVKKRKPDTEPYELAIRKIGSTGAEKVIVFGDKKADMEPAIKLSLTTCGCLWGADEISKKDLREMKLDYCFETPEQAYKCFAVG